MLRRLRLRVPDRNDDRGAVVILFAIFLIVFMVLLAFVVDLGQVYARKAQLQGVVDAAALAGVGVLSCSADTTSAARTEAALYGSTYNGFLVTPTTPNSTTIQASATSTVRTFFGGFTGRPTIDVLVDATAAKDCNGGYAVFAGSDGFTDSGGTTITGAVYSDGAAQFTSNANTIVTQRIDYASTCTGCNKANVSNGGATTPTNRVASKDPRCFAYEIKLDGSGGANCSPTQAQDNTMLLQANTWTAQNSSQCSISGSVSVAWMDCGSNNVTISGNPGSTLRGIKTSGTISITANVTIGSSSQPVALYTTNSSVSPPGSTNAFEVRGNSSVTVYGYIYVPLGEVSVSGSNNLSWTGTLIAKKVDINGTGSGGGTAGFLAVAGTGRLTE